MKIAKRNIFSTVFQLELVWNATLLGKFIITWLFDRADKLYSAKFICMWQVWRVQRWDEMWQLLFLAHLVSLTISPSGETMLSSWSFQKFERWNQRREHFIISYSIINVMKKIWIIAHIRHRFIIYYIGDLKFQKEKNMLIN